jgi:hypothetical protein
MNELNISGEGKPDVTDLGTTPPNQEEFVGYGHVGSTHNLGRALSPVRPINQIFYADKTGSTQPQPKGPSPVKLPDMRFKVSEARMGQPQSQIVAGQGSVPIRPSGSNAGTSVSYMRKATPKSL